MLGLQQSQAPLPTSETSEAIALFLLLPRAVLLLLFALQKTGLLPAEVGHLDLLYLFSGFVTAMHQISYIPVSRIFFTRQKLQEDLKDFR